MDKVFIKRLELYTLIGVYDFERDAKQRIFVDVEMITNLAPAGKSDHVSDTLDYGAIANRLAEIADRAEYRLLEALADKMINMILQEFAPHAVTLTVHKPDILTNAESVGIVVSRKLHTDTVTSIAVNSGET